MTGQKTLAGILGDVCDGGGGGLSMIILDGYRGWVFWPVLTDTKLSATFLESAATTTACWTLFMCMCLSPLLRLSMVTGSPLPNPSQFFFAGDASGRDGPWDEQWGRA